MKPHRELIVWKKSFTLVKSLYSATMSFPSDEKFGLTSQIRRAAVSVPANIAEGAARRSKKEYVQFLYISLGSTSELDTLILLCHELEYISREKAEAFCGQLEEISMMLSGLIRRNSAQI